MASWVGGRSNLYIYILYVFPWAYGTGDEIFAVDGLEIARLRDSKSIKEWDLSYHSRPTTELSVIKFFRHDFVHSHLDTVCIRIDVTYIHTPVNSFMKRQYTPQ